MGQLHSLKRKQCLAEVKVVRDSERAAPSVTARSSVTTSKASRSRRSAVSLVERSLQRQVDGLSVRAHDGNANARRGDVDVVEVPNLSRLVDHLHLFLVVTIFHHRSVVREQVEGVL